MVRSVKLSRAVPRDPGAVKRQVDVHVHLRALWIGGAVLAAGALAVDGPERLDPPTWGFLALALGLLMYAGTLFFSAGHKARTRLRLLVHGRFAEATVIGHDTAVRRSALGFRRTMHVVRAEVRAGGQRGGPAGQPIRGAMETTFRAMLDALPVGATLPALVDEQRGDLLFPHELMIAVEATDAA